MKNLLLNNGFVASCLLMAACQPPGNYSYEVEPYSQSVSDQLLATGLDINDPPPKETYELLKKVKRIHFYSKPNQQKAFPIIEDYRKTPAQLVLSDEEEVAEAIKKMRSGGFPPEFTSFGQGTLHIIVEFDEMPTQSAYYILYLWSGDGTPVFTHDARGLDLLYFLEWISQEYPELFN